MPAKIARSAPRPSLGPPELLVAIHTSRQSCSKAGKARIFALVWESSGESRLKALCPAGGGGDSYRAFRDSAPRHVADWQSLRPGHGPVVSVDRCPRYLGGDPASGGVCRLKSASRSSLPIFAWICELPCIGRRLPLRDR